MNDFCKLFEHAEYGQILVKIDKDEDEMPEVRFYAQPKGLGVCSVAVSFTDDDEGWSSADELFAKVDKDRAIKALSPVWQLFKES